MKLITAKAWYKSATIWFNVLAGLSVLIDWMVSEGFAFVDSPIFASIVAIVNVLLRFRTVRPVASTQKDVQVASLPDTKK